MANIVNCSVVGQNWNGTSYDTSAAYAGFNYNNVFYRYAMKFVTPSFSGTSQKIVFGISFDMGSRNGSYSSKLNLRWAITSSEDAVSRYNDTKSAVSEENQIATGRQEFSGLGWGTVAYIEVESSLLRPNTDYYLVLWGDNTGGYGQDYATVNAPENHTIELHYSSGGFFYNHESSPVLCDVYVKTSTGPVPHDVFVNDGGTAVKI